MDKHIMNYYGDNDQWRTASLKCLYWCHPVVKASSPMLVKRKAGLSDRSRTCVSMCIRAYVHFVFPFSLEPLVGLTRIFTIGANTHVKCWNDNYKVIGHMVWQPCWDKRSNVGPLSPKPLHGKKLKLCTCQALPVLNKWFFFFNDVIGAFVMTS